MSMSIIWVFATIQMGTKHKNKSIDLSTAYFLYFAEYYVNNGHGANESEDDDKQQLWNLPEIATAIIR